ncbi:hypothetical protein [Aquirufa rosea]|uniref:YfhO family protein n=1 Tax=Aquirufa rosea TaxID=2509241 RepID=A0A4Q1C369_9BACT|nr:hypothetical protein [Aquirufa rosea]RXK52575.1 hypothetical protein ESB04_02685 [Aquirufa rosea]
MYKVSTYISTIIILSLIGVYVCYIYNFSLDFPFQDDVSLLDFVNTTLIRPWNWSVFLHELFRVDNDHSIALPRLITWLDYIINGKVNFQHLIMITVVNLLFILYLLYRLFQKQQLPMVYFIPVVLIWLQPQYHEVSNWAITGLQHSLINIFLLSSLILISEKKPFALAWSILFAFLACYTYGNGFILFLTIGYLYLIQKNWKNVLIVAFGLLVFFAVYLQIYQMGQTTKFHWNISHILFSFLAFIGASATEFPKISLILSGFLGLGVVSIFVYYSWSYWKRNSQNTLQATYLSILAFILITSGLIALVRSAESYTIYSRYQLYAALSVIILYLFLLSRASAKKQALVFFIALAFSISFSGLSYFNHTISQQYKKMSFLADRINWYYNQSLLSVSSGYLSNAREIYQKAEKNQIYTMTMPWVNPIESDTGKAIKTASLNLHAKEYKDIMKQKHKTWVNHYYWLEFQEFPLDNDFKKQWYIIIRLKNQSRYTYVLPIQFGLNGKKNFILWENYRAKYGSIKFNHESIQDGTYEMYLWSMNSHQTTPKKELYKLEQELTINSQIQTLELK